MTAQCRCHLPSISVCTELEKLQPEISASQDETTVCMTQSKLKKRKATDSMRMASEGKRRKAHALFFPSAEPTELGDPSARLIQALRRRDETIFESLPCIPTLEQFMEANEGLTKLTMSEEECFDHMMRLT